MNSRNRVETRKRVSGSGVCAVLFAVGMALASGNTQAAPRKRLLRFGVASDVHVSQEHHGNGSTVFAPEECLEKALAWFRDEQVEAVLFPGDFTHVGRVWELERFAEIWNEFFPHDRRPDGEKVELMVVTGNHEFAPWPWDGVPEDVQRKERIDYGDNKERLWERNLRQKYEPIWRRDVKGVTFIGAQWQINRKKEHPDVAAWFRAHRDELDSKRPFFYCQHDVPRGTSFGVQVGGEPGASAALAGFPYAVALSGHLHNSLLDERCVWQGAFTSVSCGCTHEGGWAGSGYRERASGYVGYRNQVVGWLKERYARQPMAGITYFGNEGGGCLIIDVYADGLVVKRHSNSVNEPFGPDWIIPLPAQMGSRLDYEMKLYDRAAPEFAEGARAKAEIVVNPPRVGPALKDKPCVRVSFPCAQTVKGARVLDYVVKAIVGGREIADAAVLSYGYFKPGKSADVDGECLFGLHELPAGRKVVFSVTPRECYGVAGAAIFTPPLKLPAAE